MLRSSCQHKPDSMFCFENVLYFLIVLFWFGFQRKYIKLVGKGRGRKWERNKL